MAGVLIHRVMCIHLLTYTVDIVVVVIVVIVLAPAALLLVAASDVGRDDKDEEKGPN